MMTTEHGLPTVKELQKRLALAEAQKAAEDSRGLAAADAEKKALLEQKKITTSAAIHLIFVPRQCQLVPPA